ncbi:uncharacterized protein LOC134247754 [Saccostrea cucullata]|uniref:uncharacterized protein LOC134247754 n=1 Tax=Saccostrea cuccullata TaxID=36930 RepID=UPI002ED050FD
MESESDVEIFKTQSSFRTPSDKSDNDTDTILNDILDLENSNANFELRATPLFVKNPTFSDISDFEGDDLSLIKASQEIENRALTKECVSTRFSKPLQEADLKRLVQSTKSKNTENKAKWAVNLFDDWKEKRNKSVQITEEPNSTFVVGELMKMDNMSLDKAMQFFIAEVHNKSGGEYHPNTLYEIVISIQHFLRASGRFVSFLDDTDFVNMRSVLDAKMKELSRRGIGINRKQADIISVEQENEMWERGILGTDTAKKLVDTLLYSIGLNFALRAGQEHRNLRIGTNSQLSLHISKDDGRRYLQYTEDVSKSNTGGLNHRKIAPKVTRAYENVDEPERCLIKIFEKYISLRPPNGKSTALYLRPKQRATETVWFDDVPIGVHQLQQVVGKLCKAAGFHGNFTNHSLRATAATRLYQAGVDEQLIVEKTGHRSNAVRAYKRTSTEQMKEVSDVVQSKLKKVSAENDGAAACEKNSASREINITAGNVSVHVRL